MIYGASTQLLFIETTNPIAFKTFTISGSTVTLADKKDNQYIYHIDDSPNLNVYDITMADIPSKRVVDESVSTGDPSQVAGIIGLSN